MIICQQRNLFGPERGMDTEGSNTAIINALSQSAVSECPLETNQEEECSQPKQRDDTTNEKLTGMIHKDTEEPLGNVTTTIHEETTAHEHNSDPQLGVPQVHTSDVMEKQKEEEEALQKGRLLQIVLPVLVEGDGLCLTTEEKRLCVKVNSQSNLYDDKDSDQVKPHDNSVFDVKEPAKEAAVSLPAKKKRRMGMRGLTEKKRSQFVPVQKCENGQNQNICEMMEEKQSIDISAEPLPMETSVDSPSTHQTVPVDDNLKRGKELQPVNSQEKDSTTTEVHAPVKSSSETNTVCEKEGNQCEAEEQILTQHPESDPPAEEPEEKHSGNHKLQEPNRSETESREPECEIQAEKDGSSPAQCSLEDSVYTSHSEKIGKQEAIIAAVTGEEVSAPTADTQATEVNFVQTEVNEAAVMPSVSQREEKGKNEDKPAAGSSPGNAVHKQTKITTEPNGSVCSEYVSDSQLNTIDLIEDKELEKSQRSDASVHHEDSTNLICGLIKELSSLNRRVMATHRELENLRRSSKSSRSSRR
ncbi:histone acetyltransferase KAT6A-like isoform X2 [Gouania willdenowi]|uniref:histone acetyltransferase KAT6A-like isoform X2 n=2 Tax=Gouania willdenowi TaxID=441366 RepID=UPI0010552550|nr:histone acetyltransferase KAT6A-like isoform X2 [Gouania willdenowi]